ncbi:MAG TPA: ribose-phosphate diphosphokinase [archaeon]|nr:ribose-phosphate diphosphokinase [archaeon]
MIVFPMESGKKLGAAIAKKCGAKVGELKTTRFPDGEFHMQFLDDVRGADVVLVQSMQPNPNDALLQLVFAGRTAHDLGAHKVIGVVPYMAYMRQDKRFHAGECVSNRIAAHLLNQSIDKVITIDPHLHRVHDLAELFHIERKKLSANNEIANFIKKKFSARTAVIAGPDMESSQWAKTIADSIGFESAIFTKERFSSHHVKVSVTRELNWKGKEVIIVDDIVSAGHTMVEATKEIRKRKPKAVHCICVHPVFASGAFEKIKKAGVKTIVSCNTIEHKSNGIDLSGMIAKELKGE